MARFDLRDELHQRVTATLDEGQLCCWAQKSPREAGNYYAPTVLGNVTAGMTGFRQGAVWSGSNPDHRSRR
ncbi:hypothetical protein LNP25_23490 [Klebsiella variicola subsp. variicola]|nr:hypothetical protein [Klebsiella variicola subsp. variicola]